MKRAIVDFERVLGRIRPQHSIPFASRGGRGFLPAVHEAVGEAELYTRVRESLLGYGKSGDIPYIFRNFDADVNDPASYYFPQTDAAMEDAATYAKRIIYNLGGPREMVEPRIYCTVPKDARKWAQICCNLIRHYNDGLWNGFRYGIQYWEIWNEPDNPVFWDGTAEQYFELYAETATRIKALDPTLKVGGPSLALIDEKGFAFLEAFLAFVREHRLPLDFLSWHACDLDVDEIAYRAARVRRTVAASGLSPELLLDEWACIDEHSQELSSYRHLRDAQGAAYASALMTVMQREGIDASILCDARSHSIRGSLLDWYGEWQKPLHALIAFRHLYELGQEAEALGFGVYALAATDKNGHAAILLSHYDEKTERCEICVSGFGPCRVTYRVLDGTRDLEEVRSEEYRGDTARLAAELRGYATVLIELERV